MIDILQVVIPPTIEDTESSEDQASFELISLSYTNLIYQARKQFNQKRYCMISDIFHHWDTFDSLKYISDL